MRSSAGHVVAVFLFSWDDCVGCGVGERVGGWRQKGSGIHYRAAGRGASCGLIKFGHLLLFHEHIMRGFSQAPLNR